MDSIKKNCFFDDLVEEVNVYIAANPRKKIERKYLEEKINKISAFAINLIKLRHSEHSVVEIAQLDNRELWRERLTISSETLIDNIIAVTNKILHCKLQFVVCSEKNKFILFVKTISRDEKLRSLAKAILSGINQLNEPEKSAMIDALSQLHDCPTEELKKILVGLGQIFALDTDKKLVYSSIAFDLAKQYLNLPDPKLRSLPTALFKLYIEASSNLRNSIINVLDMIHKNENIPESLKKKKAFVMHICLNYGFTDRLPSDDEENSFAGIIKLFTDHELLTEEYFDAVVNCLIFFLDLGTAVDDRLGDYDDFPDVEVIIFSIKYKLLPWADLINYWQNEINDENSIFDCVQDILIHLFYIRKLPDFGKKMVGIQCLDVNPAHRKNFPLILKLYKCLSDLPDENNSINRFISYLMASYGSDSETLNIIYKILSPSVSTKCNWVFGEDIREDFEAEDYFERLIALTKYIYYTQYSEGDHENSSDDQLRLFLGDMQNWDAPRLVSNTSDFYLQMKALTFLCLLRNSEGEQDIDLQRIAGTFQICNEIIALDFEIEWSNFIDLMSKVKNFILPILDSTWIKSVSNKFQLFLLIHDVYTETVNAQGGESVEVIEKIRGEIESDVIALTPVLNATEWVFDDYLDLKKKYTDLGSEWNRFREPFYDNSGNQIPLFNFIFFHKIIGFTRWNEFVSTYLKSKNSAVAFSEAFNGRLIELNAMAVNYIYIPSTKFTNTEIKLIVNCQKVWGLLDHHPIIIALLNHITISKEEIDGKKVYFFARPYRVYAQNKLHANNPISVNGPEVLIVPSGIGEPLRPSFNFPQIIEFKRSLIINIPSDLSMATWEEICSDLVTFVNDNSLLKERVPDLVSPKVIEKKREIDGKIVTIVKIKKISWDYIQRILASREIANWLALGGNPTPFQAEFFSCLHYVCSLSNERKESEFSERDIAVVRLAASMHECETGKQNGLKGYYKFIPDQFKIVMNSSLNTVIDSGKKSLFEFYQEFVEKQIDDKEFLQLATDFNEIYEPLHQIKQIKNMVAPVVGLVHEIEFDKHANVVSEFLIKDYSVLVNTFIQRISPPKFVDYVIAKINFLISEKNWRQFSRLVDQLSELARSIGADPSKLFEVEFDVEGNEVYLVKPYAIVKACEGAGFFKRQIAISESSPNKRAIDENAKSGKKQRAKRK